MTGTWPAGWAVGDLTLAAQYAKGIGCISDTTLGGSAASVDVSSIVATYAHLLIVTYSRGDTAALSTNLNIRFNNDSTASYDSQQLRGNATTVSATESFAGTAAIVGAFPANTAGANLFGVSMIFIPHYAGSSNNKVALAVSAYKVGTATTSMSNYLMGGFWRSSAAINRITLFPSAGNVVSGTRVSIYGMGA